MLLASNNKYAYIMLIIVVVITFIIRVSTFLLFKDDNLPKSIKYISDVLPLAIMPILVVYCIRDTTWVDYKNVLATFIAIAITAAIHFWKKNMILSLIIGTATFMILIRILG